MSPLLDRQQRAVELGRIRIGALVEIAGRPGKTRPAKLDTFRLTSPDEAKLHAVAALYGGEVRPWRAPTGPQWEVTTTVAALPVRLPPGEPVSQWYERWPAGNCDRRCDGLRETFTGGDCLCPPDLEQRKIAAQLDPPEACKPRTRLSLILADIPGLGVWVLTSTGDQAADELAGVATLLHNAAVQGVILPATLRLTQRETKNRGQVKRYAVPVLDVAESFAALASGNYARPALGASTAAAAALPAGSVVEGVATVHTSPEDITVIDPTAQAIADEAMDPIATADDVRDYWRIAKAKDLLEREVVHGSGRGMLGDLLTVRLRVLVGDETASHESS